MKQLDEITAAINKAAERAATLAGVGQFACPMRAATASKAVGIPMHSTGQDAFSCAFLNGTPTELTTGGKAVKLLIVRGLGPITAKAVAQLRMLASYGCAFNTRGTPGTPSIVNLTSCFGYPVVSGTRLNTESETINFEASNNKVNWTVDLLFTRAYPHTRAIVDAAATRVTRALGH